MTDELITISCYDMANVCHMLNAYAHVTLYNTTYDDDDNVHRAYIAQRDIYTDDEWGDFNAAYGTSDCYIDCNWRTPGDNLWLSINVVI